ncbi:MAG TPA: PKD domain-containing protein [Thermoplasmata archaeon]|nr:PKD domain-containing protein [Thermoplasmata archaeon]
MCSATAIALAVLAALNGAPPAMSSGHSGPARDRGAPEVPTSLTNAIADPSVPPQLVPVNGSVPAWANLTVPGAPAPDGRLFATGVTYDVADKYVLIFGGYTGRHSYLNDTWAYAAGHWTNLTKGPSPNPRDHATLAYDPVDGYVLLFGGSNATQDFNDSWSFRAGSWTRLVTPVAPSPRWASAMTYDARDRYVILFGGCQRTSFNDTWTFAGGTWTHRTPSVFPLGRGGASMAFDPADNYVTLYGGYNDTPAGAYTLLADTWWWANGSWQPVASQATPSPRRSAGFAYAPALNEMVLFGGGTANGVANDTWLFVHREWRNVTAGRSPVSREFALMAYDANDGYVMMFGGGGGGALQNDTWAYDVVTVYAAATPAGGLAPLNVTLTEATAGGFGTITASWSFGDGSSGSGAVVTHEYRYGGVFRASVTVLDRYGALATAVLTAWVAGPLNGTFTVAAEGAPALGEAPLTVNFSAVGASGIPPYLYNWSFQSKPPSNGVGNGNASHLYAAPGSYSAMVQAWDRFSERANASVAIRVVPAVAVRLGWDRTLSGPGRLTFNGVANVTGGFAPYGVNWSWGDGAFSNGTNATHVYTLAATYTVTISVVDGAGRVSAFRFPLTVSASPAGLFATVLGGPTGLAVAVLGGAVIGALVTHLLTRRKAPPDTRAPPDAPLPPEDPGISEGIGGVHEGKV